MPPWPSLVEQGIGPELAAGRQPAKPEDSRPTVTSWPARVKCSARSCARSRLSTSSRKAWSPSPQGVEAGLAFAGRQVEDLLENFTQVPPSDFHLWFPAARRAVSRRQEAHSSSGLYDRTIPGSHSSASFSGTEIILAPGIPRLAPSPRREWHSSCLGNALTDDMLIRRSCRFGRKVTFSVLEAANEDGNLEALLAGSWRSGPGRRSKRSRGTSRRPLRRAVLHLGPLGPRRRRRGGNGAFYAYLAEATGREPFADRAIVDLEAALAGAAAQPFHLGLWPRRAGRHLDFRPSLRPPLRTTAPATTTATARQGRTGERAMAERRMPTPSCRAAAGRAGQLRPDPGARRLRHRLPRRPAAAGRPPRPRPGARPADPQGGAALARLRLVHPGLPAARLADRAGAAGIFQPRRGARRAGGCRCCSPAASGPG